MPLRTDDRQYSILIAEIACWTILAGRLSKLILVGASWTSEHELMMCTGRAKVTKITQKSNFMCVLSF